MASVVVLHVVRSGLKERIALLVLDRTRGVRGLNQSGVRVVLCHVVLHAELVVDSEPRTLTFVRRCFLQTRIFPNHLLKRTT